MNRRSSLEQRWFVCAVLILFSTAPVSLGALTTNPPQSSSQSSNNAQEIRPDARGLRLENLFVARETQGTLFDNVVATLRSKYYDKTFRNEVLPQLVSQYAERAKQAKTLEQEREVVEELLSHIPSSHLGLLSKRSHHDVMFDLLGREYPTFGFQVMKVSGNFYAFAVFEGGPGEKAGVRPWDRILTIDGVPVNQSPRLDWRSDDAYIGDDRDPPVHYLMADKADIIKVKIERSRGKQLSVSVPAEDYSALDAAKASARVYSSGNKCIGYLHLWYVHIDGAHELLKKELDGQFADCAAFVFDLRGRGGSAAVIAKILDVLKQDNSARHRPVIALIDRQSRSAKDVLAYELKTRGLARLVGEPTAGAVIPASFADVGHDSVLMFPSFKLPRYTDLLESKPVQPDVLVERAGPMSGGDDPILKAGLAEATKLITSGARPNAVQ
jgi:carboxyl-terminal processing protease